MRRAAAAPDAPAQLVELREPEALGVVDDHHRRRRHVDADLDHRGRDEHVELAGAQRAHPASRSTAVEPAVHEPDAQRRQLVGQPSSAVVVASAHVAVAPRRARPAGTPRTRARPRATRSREQLVRRLLAARAATGRASSARLAPRRQLVEHGDVEVAVRGERERARDRRRGHHEEVRRALPVALVAQLRALRDAEAVLLVDDDEPEPREPDALGEQRVRADRRRRARRRRAARASTRARRAASTR